MASQDPTVVAVAGGTGGVGKSIVNVLSARHEFKVIVLSRKASTSLRNAALVSVDYQSVEAMVSMLESNNVHTVISTLYDEAGAEQLKLIAAATKSQCTQRFIASDWGVQFPPEAARELPFVAWRFKAIDALQGSGLEWTRVHNGYFLDYYGHSSNMTGPPFIVDVAARTAVIPGVGDEVLALTHTHDVGRFVAALLGLPTGEWEEATFMYGERVTWKDVIRTAEEVTGSTFDVSHDDMETLQQCRFTPLPGHKGMGAEGLRLFALLGLYAAQGLFDTPPERSLNSRFPDIKPISVHDFMQLSWGDDDAVVDKIPNRADYCLPREGK